MGRRIGKILERHPWLVLDDGGEILGYVYASGHSERAAYGWSANVSAYIADGRRGQGIGRALYTSLFALLKLQGFVNLYAGITLPNPASVGIHEAMGFELVGVYRQVGFKCGAWHDVGWWQGSLVERPNRPEPTNSLDEARELPGWDQAIGSGLSILRLPAIEAVRQATPS
jgi:phosphinothricin acetyltransferase